MAPNASKRGRAAPSGVQRHIQHARPNFANKPASKKQAPPPPPPSYVPRGEQRTTRHLLELVDAKTRGTVHENTTLVALYNYPQDLHGHPADDRFVNRELLRNLTEVAEPAMLCRLVLDQEVYPRDSSDGYILYITFSNLYLAPCIRLECLFKENPQEKEYLKLVTEFHFNALSAGGLSISDFAWYDVLGSSTGRIEFTSRNVTCSGFGLVQKHEHMFGATQQQIVDILDSLQRRSGELKRLRFEVEQPTSIAGSTGLQAVRDRLPGGNGRLLASIGQPEYACFGPSRREVAMDDLHIPTVGELMMENPPFPMVVMPCHDTFTTLKEFQVQMYMSTSIQYEEEKRALDLWSSVHHKCAIYQVGLDQPVLGVRFEWFPTLSSRRERSTYRLPNGLNTKIIFTVAGTTYKLSGFQIGDAPGLPPSDAYFVITTHQASFFNSWCNLPSSSAPVTFHAKFFPACPMFTRNSQMATTQQLALPDNERWHCLLLNQDDALQHVDLTAGADPETRDKADIWIKNYMDWNLEQKMAIDTIRETKGGVMLVHGPAGTGKTLLQQALSIYFWKLGFHVLALAPANSNADQLTRAMARLAIPGLRFNRVYPASRDRGIDRLSSDMHPDEAQYDTVHEVRYILAQIADHENQKVNARDYGLEQTVINEAETGDLTLWKEMAKEGSEDEDDDDAMADQGIFDVWEVFRDCITQMRQRTFNAGDPLQRKMFTWSYEHCKAHIVRLSRYAITTTGNVRCTELMQNFGRNEQGNLDDCNGIVVFVDEACKDVEQNVWAGIVCEAWSKKVQGAIMLGDDKQLKPINKNSRGALEFNPYNNRLEVSLPMRLVREGKPCIELREQMRMHQCISDFPSKWFYDRRLINGPGTHDTLETDMPGLQRVLAEIILGTNAARTLDMARPNMDMFFRNHYVQVTGAAEHNDSRSKRVKKHADVFFDNIFHKLHAYFQDKMEDNVMVIVSYSYSLFYWQSRANEILRTYGLSQSHLPKIVMLDSSQGMESFMVLFDGCMQYWKALGFMEDHGRVNVALTRAKAVRWVIGGQIINGHSYQQDLPVLAEFKMEMDAKSLVSNFDDVRVLGNRMETVVDKQEMLDY